MTYDKNVLSPIKIDGWAFPANFASYIVKNTFDSDSAVETMSNHELDVDSVDACYRPRVDITFGAVDIEDYRTFIRKVNRRSFNLSYYDYELKQNVTRVMRTTATDINKLYAQLANIFGVTGLKVSFECVYGYESYEDLISGEHL